MGITSDLNGIKTVSDTLTNNKVSRFAYTQEAYTVNHANGTASYDPNQDNNIPLGTASNMKVNQTVIELGWRARASSITRMLMNHFLGRISYNLNKANDMINELLTKLIASLGTADGIATLDSNGRIPYSQLPESAVELKGYWNASTNTPTLVDGTGTNGDEYYVDVAGTQDLGSGEQYFAVGDRVLYLDGVWRNISGASVRSVNNVSPNAQGEVTNVLGTNYFPITKGFLGAIFGKLFGRSWTQGTGGGTSRYVMSSVYYGNGLWVAGVGGLWWSTDGKSWTQGTGINGDRLSVKVVYYANGLWVAVIDEDSIYWSTDGKSWTQGTGGDGRIRGVYYANGLWVAGGSYGIYWSTDGKSWTQGTDNGGGKIYYANGLWVSFGSDPFWSTDGKSWTRGTGIEGYAVASGYYGNGLWVASTSSHGLYWSTDGKSWTQGTAGTNDFGHVYYANGLWVAGSHHGLYWSTDGKSWTQGAGGIDPYSFYYANGLWVAGSQHGLWWSTDGKSWTQGAGGTSYSFPSVYYANGLWVAGSYDRIYWSSLEQVIEGGTIDLGANIPIIDA